MHECGALPCGPFSFCHEATNTCKECAPICDESTHGHYDPALCLSQCKDYLTSTSAVDGTARVLGSVGLALGVLALVAVIALAGLLFFFLYRRPRQLLAYLQNKVDVEAPDMKAKMSTNNNKCDIGRDLNSSVCTVSGSVSEADLRLHNNAGAMAVPQQPHQHLPLGVAALGPLPPPPPPARHPSEDSTLDYAAYDNPALSPSSSPLPPGTGGASGAGSAHASHGKAMDAVLEAVMDHHTLPGSVPLQRGQLHNGMTNGSVARMESSF